MRFIAAAFCLVVSPMPTSARPRLSAPADLTDPRPAPVRLSGLVPGAPVTISTTRLGDEGRTFIARATFRADGRGRVDTATRRPIDGSYQNVDPLALFWSAAPRKTEMGDPAPGVVRVSAEAGGRVVATALVRARPDPANLVTVTDTPFPGAVFVRPAGSKRHPVIIVLGGSEGGSSTARSLSPLLAARGYAVLGLAYYNPGYDPGDLTPGLPASFTEIPVDRLDQVRAWLARQPGVDIGRLGLWGASKGAEFALIAATRFPWIRAVAAIVPSDLVWEGWGRAGAPTASFAFGGSPLAFQPYDGMAAELAKAAKGQAMDLRRVHEAGRRAFPERVAAARIPVESYRGALLVAGGGRDAIWPSAEMATSIAAARGKGGLKTVLLTYPGAGHLLGGPGTTPARDLTGAGGDATSIAHARAEVWRRTFDLFATALDH